MNQALEELSFYIGRAYYNYKLLLERTLRELGLEHLVSPGMGHLLFALFEEDGCILKQLTEKTRLSAPTITVMLRKMEEVGLVRARRDPGDRRAVRVRLTPRGRSIEPRCRKVLLRLNRVLGRGLSASDVRRARRSLARMIENMRRDERMFGR